MERRNVVIASRSEMTQKFWILTLLVLAMLVGGSRTGAAASAKALNAEGAAALKSLRESNLVAGKLASTAKGILVFPNIVKIKTVHE